MIRTYQPACTVTLFKTVQRNGQGASQRATSSRKAIDLTPYLGDQGAVTVSRSIYGPAGTFAITFPDLMDRVAMDSLYGLIEPMDQVEIRMAREPHKHAGRKLPIVMRGFVANVQRAEAMSSGGQPSRVVTIDGRDYGKIFQLVPIAYHKEYAVGNIILDEFKFFALTGVKFEFLSASDFVRRVADRVVNRWLEDFYYAAFSDVDLKIKVEATVLEGKVGPYGISPYEGDMWTFMSNWGDLLWNELFVEDRDDGAYLIYRPVPFRSVNDEFIMDGAVDPGIVEITDQHVDAIRVSRGDGRIANFYHVEAPRSYLTSVGLLTTEALQKGSVFLKDRANSSPTLYGLRRMTAQSNQTGEQNRHLPDEGREPEKPAFALHDTAWLERRRDQLKALNLDNVLFEEGTIKMCGNERIKHGIYLGVSRGSLRGEYYVSAVTHTFAPFRSFDTQVQVIRGTGFIERMKFKDSPYLAEKGRGAYG